MKVFDPNRKYIQKVIRSFAKNIIHLKVHNSKRYWFWPFFLLHLIFLKSKDRKQVSIRNSLKWYSSSRITLLFLISCFPHYFRWWTFERLWSDWIHRLSLDLLQISSISRVYQSWDSAIESWYSLTSSLMTLS